MYLHTLWWNNCVLVYIMVVLCYSCRVSLTTYLRRSFWVPENAPILMRPFVVPYSRTGAVNKCDPIWENPTFCRFHQNWEFAIFRINSVWVISLLSAYEHLQLYHPWATVLCNTAINIEGGKIVFVRTHNYSKWWIFENLVTNTCFFFWESTVCFGYCCQLQQFQIGF